MNMLNNSSGTYYLRLFVLDVTVELIVFFITYIFLQELEFLGRDQVAKNQLTNSVAKYSIYF